MSVPSRAARYSLQVVLRYRAGSDQGWHQGATENISSSGVFFRGRQLLLPESVVVLECALPGRFSGREAARLSALGRIVRVVTPSDSNGVPRMAVRFATYRLLARLPTGEPGKSG